MEAPEQDHYRVLGLQRNATSSDIRRAFVRLALAQHPDKNGGGSDDVFVQARTAYETLFDPSSRASYDRKHDRIQTEWEQYEGDKHGAPDPNGSDEQQRGAYDAQRREREAAARAERRRAEERSRRDADRRREAQRQAAWDWLEENRRAEIEAMSRQAANLEDLAQQFSDLCRQQQIRAERVTIGSEIGSGLQGEGSAGPFVQQSRVMGDFCETDFPLFSFQSSGYQSQGFVSYEFHDGRTQSPMSSVTTRIPLHSMDPFSDLMWPEFRQVPHQNAAPSWPNRFPRSPLSLRLHGFFNSF